MHAAQYCLVAIILVRFNSYIRAFLQIARFLYMDAHDTPMKTW